LVLESPLFGLDAPLGHGQVDPFRGPARELPAERSVSPPRAGEDDEARREAIDPVRGEDLRRPEASAAVAFHQGLLDRWSRSGRGLHAQGAGLLVHDHDLPVLEDDPIAEGGFRAARSAIGAPRVGDDLDSVSLCQVRAGPRDGATVDSHRATGDQPAGDRVGNSGLFAENALHGLSICLRPRDQRLAPHDREYSRHF
jgi:hypothetical protein